MALVVKNPPTNAGDGKRYRADPWVRKIPWRRAWQPTPVFLPGEYPWTEEPGGLQAMGSQRVRCTWVSEHTHREIVEDRGAWCAAAHLVAESGMTYQLNNNKAI